MTLLDGSIVVAGLATGGLYATSALCLSTTYRVSRVLNLAQGATALLAACIVAALPGLPVLLAATVAIAAAAALGLAFEATTRETDPLARLTTVIGWLLLLAGVQAAWFADTAPRFPLGTGTVRVAGVALGYDQLALVVLAVGVPAMLSRLLAAHSVGAQLLAVADAPESAATLGLDVTRIRRAVWLGTGALVGTIGVLAAPTIGLQAITALQLLAGGLAAALLGGIDRITGPAVVGFGLGLFTAVLGGHLAPALVDATLVAVVIVSLVVRQRAAGDPVGARV